MRPLLWLALGLGLLLLLGRLAALSPAGRPTPAAAASSSHPGAAKARTSTSTPELGLALPQAPCGPGLLPERGVCLPVPAPLLGAQIPGSEATPSRQAAPVPLALLPGRSRNWADYVLPVEVPAPELVTTDERGVVWLPCPEGSAVSAPELRGLRLRVVALQDLAQGHPLLLRALPEATSRLALALYGLAEVPAALQVGQELGPGAPLGRIPAAPEGLPRLGLMLLRLREGLSAEQLEPTRWLDPDVSIQLDPRSELTPRTAPTAP